MPLRPVSASPCAAFNAAAEAPDLASGIGAPRSLLEPSAGVPMSFGVLTTNTAEEALERAAPGPANKGREAADAAIEMARLFANLGDGPPSRGCGGTGS